MIPNDIKAEHVLAAIAELDNVGTPSGRGSKRYFLVHRGRRYPPKYLLSLAAKYAVGRELRPSEFNGGQETNNFLQRLGFEIEGALAGGQRIVRPNPRPPKKRGSTVHDERCKECKSAVAALLQKLYGTVEAGKRFEVGTLPGAFTTSPYSQNVRAIFEALQKARGFQDFVRSPSLPSCDYFVPNPGFILEFDESQHFTELRQLALARYPSSLPLGFDRERWIHLCRRLREHDNDPPFRDEQRAWYDTLRDFLPTALPLKATVRLYASEYPWCELTPASTTDIETFRQILSERTQFWTIAMGGIRSQRFARLVMDGAWSGDLNAARRLLGDVARAWPPTYRVKCLCTCGAFLRFNWPPDLAYEGNLNPSSQEIKALIVAAEKAVWSVLTQDIVSELRGCCDYITLGVDTKKDKVSTTYNVIDQPHAELVCLVDLRDTSIHWTGKFYPTSNQEQTIVRFPDLQSHFVKLDCGRVMVLGCHDLTVYSPRGQARAGRWRKNISESFRELARQQKPIVVLHHPHTTVKSNTWRQQWNRLGAELPSVGDYLGTGAYSFRDDGWNDRDGLACVLSSTQRGDILNISVRLGVTGANAGAPPGTS